MLYKRFNILAVSYADYARTTSTHIYRGFSKMSEHHFCRQHMLLMSADTGFGKTQLVKLLYELSAEQVDGSYLIFKIPSGSSLSAFMDGPVEKLRK